MKPRRLVCLVIFVTTAASMSACGNDTYRTGIFLSPDGSLVADWYTASCCGAAGSVKDYVQLRRRTERFRFKDDAIFEGGGSNAVRRVVWKSPSELEITYPALTTVIRSESRWNNVAIRYREDAELREGDAEPGTYHFTAVASPDSQIYAEWTQYDKRGDGHWWDDCLELIPLNQGMNTVECSFVGITGDNLNRRWDTSRHLHIAYPPGTKVIKADAKWNDVTITYAEDPKLQKY
jgi:hypothetical protein